MLYLSKAAVDYAMVICASKPRYCNELINKLSENKALYNITISDLKGAE